MKPLYKLNNNNKLLMYKFHVETNTVTYGQVDGILQEIDFNGNMTTAYKNKLNEGYVPFPLGTDIAEITELLLKTTLSGANNVTLPMLATKIKLGTTKLKYPYGGSRKLNGLRCKISFNPNKKINLFSTNVDKVVLATKSGNEYYMPHIAQLFYDNFYCFPHFQEYEFDGEFYEHGMPLNHINKCVPMITNGKPENVKGNPYDIKFVMYDLIIPNVKFKDRLRIYNTLNLKDISVYLDKLEHINVTSDEELIKYRDLFISEGYEGIVIRDYDKSYQYGKRNTAMFKFKLALTDEFQIIDVVAEGVKNNKNIIKVILKNDINEHTFEAVPGDLNNSWTEEDKVELYNNKMLYIGKQGTVSYYERSGVKKVPSHANFIAVRNYE